MDLVPFLELDMLHLKDTQINELKKFCKINFDSTRIFSTAEELKYTSLIKNVILNETESPSEGFVRYLLSDIYEGQKNQKVIEKFTPIVKKSFSGLINDIVNQKISSALTNDADKEIAVSNADNLEQDEQPPSEDSKIITTQYEIEAFYIIRGLLVGVVPLEDIVYRDTESYFSILYKNNNRKPICRINLDKKSKQLFIPDENKKFERFYLDNLNELYLYKDNLVDSVTRYI